MSQPDGAPRSRFARNATALLVARVTDVAAGLLIVRLLAPHLGPARFGDYAWVSAFVLALQPLVMFGMHGLLMREAAREPARIPALWAAVCLVKGTLLLPFWGICIAASVYLDLPPAVALSLLLAAAAETLFHLHQTHSSIVQSVERMDVELGLTLAFRSTLLVGTWLGVVQQRGLAFFFVALLLASAVRALLGGGLTLAWFGRPRFAGAAADARRLARLGVPLMLSLILRMLILTIPVFLLKGLAPAVEVGYYQMANGVLMQALAVPAALMTALLPGLARSWSHDRPGFPARVRRATAWLVAIGVVAATTLWLAAGLIVEVLGAGEFGPAAPAMRVIALALPPMFAIAVFHFTLVAADGQRALAIGAAIGASSCAVAGALLIPEGGAIGAATTIATALLVTAIADGLLMLRRLRRRD